MKRMNLAALAGTLLFGLVLGGATLVTDVRAAGKEKAPAEKPAAAPQQGEERSLAEAASELKAAAEPSTERAVQRGLTWLAAQQSQDGSWSARGGQYPAAMTALAGMALLGEGSTTAQGKYAANVRRAVDYLVGRSQPDGLIGDPKKDMRYTYGHGFSMLFLSQVLKHEQDAQRRAKLTDVLTRAVAFTGKAQTTAGGWGYVSAKDGADFDEGSTTVTQVQGLGACRGAGIPVPKQVLDRAIDYLRKCTLPDGGLKYSLRMKGGGGRPAITAAGVACLDSTGHRDAEYRAKLLGYCKNTLAAGDGQTQGHWHYANLYFAQDLYRDGGQTWQDYRRKVYAQLVAKAAADGSWSQGFIGPVYTTAVNLTILQLEKGAVPIYRR